MTKLEILIIAKLLIFLKRRKKSNSNLSFENQRLERKKLFSLQKPDKKMYGNLLINFLFLLIQELILNELCESSLNNQKIL
jgi:hypothetical protein